MDITTALLVALLILLASMISVELGISVAIIELVFGVIGGNYLGLRSTEWIEYLAAFGAMVLVFLAGTEINLKIAKEQLGQTLLIGTASFLVPFAIISLFIGIFLGWGTQAALLGGIVLATASIAITYSLVTETRLTNHPTGRAILTTTYLTDLAAVVALNFCLPLRHQT